MAKYVCLCAIIGSINSDNTATMVVRIGNKLQASVSGVDTPGATFLQRDIILTEGVVFAYSAFFRSDKPATFQIWRPTANQGADESTIFQHRLLAQTRIIPSLVLGREDVYIESRMTEKCVQVMEGDRLGLFFEASPGSIAYVFDDAYPTALSNRIANTSIPYAINDIINFDALLFPYDFSFAAYVDTNHTHYEGVDPSSYFVDCYPGVLIPDYGDLDVLTKAPPTGFPGATGATGAPGARGLPGPPGSGTANGIIGSTGATGPTGLIGPRGSTGVRGMPGPRGNVGSTGAEGPAGVPGPRGPPGHMSVGTNVSLPVPAVTEHPVLDFFARSEMSLTYMIWLIILTLIIVILIIVIIIQTRRANTHRQPEDYCTKVEHSVRGAGVVRSDPDTVTTNWKDFLKTEAETSYANDTLQGEIDVPSPYHDDTMSGENDTPSLHHDEPRQGASEEHVAGYKEHSSAVEFLY